MAMAVNFKTKAEKFVRNEERSAWHDTALWFVRSKRDIAIEKVENWEDLRKEASNIKDHCLSKLDEYLLEFEKNAISNGVVVHWAKDGEEHNRIIGEILEKHKVKKIVKSKSMLTEECGLNPYLEKNGFSVIDTDLGERIIQLREEPPSHIVLPAIHLKKEDVSELFHEKFNTEEGNNDPGYLTYQARLSLRNDFLEAEAALTGVNFGIAETGEVVICTNEGNADVGANIAPLQIHSMGIEKLLPGREHLGVFTRMLARNATGQPITVYTSHYKNPKGNGEMHIVLVDNGRSERLGNEDFRSSLKCIRCGACMNTCPIYRRSGGHSYGATIPGPIGAILSPNLDLTKYSELPFASTLCGSCTDVCPVKIDIHTQLYKWRQVIGANNVLPKSKTMAMGIAGKMLKSPKAFNMLFRIGRIALNILPSFIINNRWNAWGKGRAMPEIKKKKFDKN
ncbi:MAG: lactate utilization protein B [Bacteroidota bacterium]